MVYNYAIGTGNRVTLPPGPGAYIVKGAFLDVDNPCTPWTQFLDGGSLPGSPWVPFQGGGPNSTTRVVDFLDPDLGAMNRALRINSGPDANEWYVGLAGLDEFAAGARFRLVDFTSTGKEDLLCVTTHSTPLAPAPSITLVNGRYKLWNYVNSNTAIMDLGLAVTNQWHTAYLYARNDGKVMLWWDGVLKFDGMAPLVSPFNAYVEWGSGSWQYDATTTVDFDWVAYGNPCNLPQSLRITRAGNAVVIAWPTNALGYVLESSDALVPGNWASVTNPAGVVGSENTLTNSVANTNKFYRLRGF
jgi:hypothetical protein